MFICHKGGILQMKISYGVPLRNPEFSQRVPHMKPIRMTAATQTGTRNRIMLVVPDDFAWAWVEPYEKNTRNLNPQFLLNYHHSVDE
jgi:hypothetical protein